MDQQNLMEKEQEITTTYRDFLSKVREAFNKHCDEIKAEAQAQFDALDEDDQEGRKKILTEQKQKLDKTLAELKQLLSKKGAEVRKQLEELANLRDQQGFDLDEQLAEVEVDQEKHAA